MFINFSNHHSSNWESSQKQAALFYGDIEDIAFPDIDPNADEIYIEELTQKYAQIIKDIINDGQDAKNVIHIMGEQTFCFALICKLKADGFKCIASTSRRMLIQKQFTKEITFNFARFRGY